jgi:5-methylcytosine-specific restriction endonuclease McrA
MRSIIKEAFKFDRRRKMPGSTQGRGTCYVEQYRPENRKAFNDAIMNSWDGKCFYTGLPIELGSTAGLDHKLPVSRAATLGPDRVFHPDNLVWCHKSVNMLKGDMTADEFAVWLRTDLPAALASLDA